MKYYKISNFLNQFWAFMSIILIMSENIKSRTTANLIRTMNWYGLHFIQSFEIIKIILQNILKLYIMAMHKKTQIMMLKFPATSLYWKEKNVHTFERFITLMIQLKYWIWHQLGPLKMHTHTHTPLAGKMHFQLTVEYKFLFSVELSSSMTSINPIEINFINTL